MLGTGWALIDARIGSSRPHNHVAHQISLAIERDLEISGDADLIVPAGHAIAIAWLSLSAPVLLTPIETAGLGDIASGADAKRWASDYLDRSQARPVDARLSEVLAAPDDLSTARALADVACLSPSRLREIVSRDFGVPPAKLLQWLQLQRAVRTLVGGGGLADAAAAGGFADQSHFTRRCAQWLGVTPSAGLSAFAFEIVP